MRLIDADKITFIECLAKLGNGMVCCHVKGIIPKEGIDMQPTVEAIPIEWIKRYAKKGGRIANILFPFEIEMMLEDWEKENE